MNQPRRVIKMTQHKNKKNFVKRLKKKENGSPTMSHNKLMMDKPLKVKRKILR